MEQKLNPLALGYSLAILSGISMLLLGILGYLGIFTEAIEMMIQWHIFFDISFIGIIAGIIEASIWGFVGGYLFGYIYNKFV